MPDIDLNTEKKIIKQKKIDMYSICGFLYVFGSKEDGLGEIFHKYSLVKTKAKKQ